MPASRKRYSPATRRLPVRVFYAVIRGIDRFTDAIGRLVALSQVVLVAIITYEVCARYFFTPRPSGCSSRAPWPTARASCSPAATRSTRARTCAPTSSGTSTRSAGKGIIDLISYLVLFFPTMIFLMWVRIDGTLHSFDTGERSQESFWRAIMWPFRATIPLAALLFMIQGVSESLKCVYQIRFGREFEHRRNSRYDRPRIPRQR